jgi:hypothetical protein
VSILNEERKELETHPIVVGSVISVPDGERVKKGDVFVEWMHTTFPIISEKAGRVEFVDIIEGVTMKQEVDEATEPRRKSSSNIKRIFTRRSSSRSKGRANSALFHSCGCAPCG